MGNAASCYIDGTGRELVRAAKAGDVDAVTELISRHPQLLRYTTLSKLTACHFAAREDHVDVLLQLFSKAEEVEFMAFLAHSQHRVPHDRWEREASAPPRQPPLAQQLANSLTDRGVTPLMLAADRCCVASVKLLLSKGANPWAVDKLGGRSALHYAARADSVEIVQLLADAAGAEGPMRFPNRQGTRYVDLRTQTGFTPVHFAVAAGAQQALAALLNRGAHPMLSSLFDSLDGINCPRGSTPLHLAARNGGAPITKQLLSAYLEQWQHRRMPDPRLITDGEDQLPCQIAARRQHSELARLLLPSTPLGQLAGDAEVACLGPQPLAAIAGAALRGQLAAQLACVRGGEADGTGAAAAEAAGGGAGGSAEAEAEAAGAAAAEAAAAAVHVPQQQQQQQHEESSAAAGAPMGEPAGTGRDSCAGSVCSSTGSLDACGVCFDGHAGVELAPCQHRLCVGCCQQLLGLNSRCVLTCPFCRANVGALAPAAPAAAAEAAAATAIEA